MISTGRIAGAIAASNFLMSPSNALVPPPAVAVSGVTPFNRPAGAAVVAAVLPSKTLSIARPRSCASKVRSDNSTLSGLPLASSFVMAVIEAAFFGFRLSAVMISAPTGIAPPSATKPPLASANAPAPAPPRRR